MSLFEVSGTVPFLQQIRSEKELSRRWKCTDLISTLTRGFLVWQFLLLQPSHGYWEIWRSTYLQIVYSIKHINFLINLFSHAQSPYDFFKHIGLCHLIISFGRFAFKLLYFNYCKHEFTRKCSLSNFQVCLLVICFFLRTEYQLNSLPYLHEGIALAFGLRCCKHRSGSDR